MIHTVKKQPVIALPKDGDKCPLLNSVRAPCKVKKVYSFVRFDCSYTFSRLARLFCAFSLFQDSQDSVEVLGTEKFFFFLKKYGIGLKSFLERKNHTLLKKKKI